MIDIISRQDGTNPTYPDLLDIMALRLGLDNESLCMEKEINYFLNYDTVFITEAAFYTEISALGRATEETVEDVLSLSGEFLRRVTDINSTFQSSQTTCLQLASDIMAFVSRGIDVDPVETGDLTELRETLRRKFARLKGSWENLLEAALNCDESAVFDELAELVEITEAATNEALFGLEDLLQSLADRDTCEWVGVED